MILKIVFLIFFFWLFRTSTTFKKLSESKWILRLASRRIMPKVLGLSWRNFLLAGLSSRSYFWHDNRCMCNTWSIQARRMSSGEVSKIWLSELFFRRVSLFSPSVSNREYCHQNEPKSALLMNVENSKAHFLARKGDFFFFHGCLGSTLYLGHRFYSHTFKKDKLEFVFHHRPLRFGNHDRLPDPDDCQKFYSCLRDGQPRLGVCPRKTVFNNATGLCDDPNTVPGW